MGNRLMAALHRLVFGTPTEVKLDVTPPRQREQFDRRLQAQRRRLMALDARIEADQAAHRR